ncbi:ParB N-terminal domain-containing protein [Desulfurococcaceae archaeon MEX13E-LK6-19]|nr:ParB N-terminal domain-containing protein [Desulfurococcaceae archaeon MEX13E-LK6-19]
MGLSNAYEIKTPLITLKITIEEVKKLHIHEEIIPEILDWLVEKIKKDKFFKDPIIVDEKTLVVLDGMHRVAATEKLGFPYIPVCLVDYDNPNIKLGSWCRIIKKGPGNFDNILEIIKSLGFSLQEVQKDEIFDLLKERKAISIATYGEKYISIIYPEKDIKKIYDLIKKIEEKLKEEGYEIGYVTEDEALSMASKKEVIASLITPTVTKQEVREVALRGEVFTHKTTRHVIPARPLNINIPLNWLTGEIPLEEARKKLVDLLSNKKIKRLPPGTVLDRKYEEELYVFE